MTYKTTSVLTLILCMAYLMFAATSFAGTTTTYLYDELNRLKEVQLGNGSGIRYEYDEIGNLLSKTPFGNVFTITASANEGGAITPIGTLTLTAGSSKTYSFTPLYGYRVSDVVVDGVSKGAVSTFQFNNLSANHTITANFATNAIAWIQGIVKNSANNPLAGVEVQLRNADSSLKESVKTASNGTYSLSAYAGSWFVDALSENSDLNPTQEQGVTLTTGQTATINFTVNTIALTPATLSGGNYKTAYNQPLAASGGIAPYSWSITAGALPTGLTLNSSTGAISGTPTVVGASSFTVQAQDANGFRATKPLGITISYPPVKLTGTTPTYYTSLQAAYTAAADGATIQCQTASLTESLSFGLNKSVTVIGGYDPLYTSSTGATTVHGAMNVTSGTVPMRSVNVQF